MKRFRFRVFKVWFVLAVMLLARRDVIGYGRNSARIPDGIDLPASFDVDFKLAAKERAELSFTKASDDISANTGADVFRTLVDSPDISGRGLPYRWNFAVVSSPMVNAVSLPDGQVAAYGGMTRLIGTNRGLWAAVLSHELAHVAGRHAVKKALLHEYIEQQILYWQLRSRYGDKNAGWAIVGLRVGGAIAEKKLSRDLEHDADVQGMMLMARAGYHPDYVFALHHLLRIDTGEQSKFAAFFSTHPRWETRDQRSERAYLSALNEYERLWPNPAASPGGTPPAVAFLAEVHGQEDKQGSTGDLVLSVSCRNLVGPVGLSVRLSRDGQPIRSATQEYRDQSGNIAIREYAPCLDKDAAAPVVVHIPSQLIPENDRKLKAEVDLLGPDDRLLERTKPFDVHFPKPNKATRETVARVFVGDSPGIERSSEATTATSKEMNAPPVHAAILAPPLQTGATTPSALLETAGEVTQNSIVHAPSVSVSVDSDPSGAEIFIDSRGIGLAPKQVQLAPGLHSVQIVKKGYEDFATRLSVEKNVPANVNAKLTASTTLAAASMTVRATKLSPAPSGGDIDANGKFVGSTIPGDYIRGAQKTVLAGQDRVSTSAITTSAPTVASNDAHAPSDHNALVTVSFTSEPDGADIFIDSMGVGSTPKRVQLQPGSHSVQMVKQGYRDWATKLSVEKGVPTSVNAKLEK
jgi:hypothetical protein